MIDFIMQNRGEQKRGEAVMATEPKKVPEWLNSSLWSTPSPSPSSSSSTPAPVVDRTPRPRFAHSSSLPAKRDPLPSPLPPRTQEEHKPSPCFNPGEPKQPLEKSESPCFDPLLSGHSSKAPPSSASSVDFDPAIDDGNGDEDGDGNGNEEEDSAPSPLPSPAQYNAPQPLPSFSRSSSLNARVNQFSSALSRKQISISELQILASQGIPDSGGIRATVWKLLLGYLPKDRELWKTELSKKRAEYNAFCEELLMTPSEISRRQESKALDKLGEGDGPLPRKKLVDDDHPLSLGNTSAWHKYFVDSEIYEQIDRDVKRTHPDMQFFCGDSISSIKNQEAMKRALFIFAKLNPGIHYVQGMNEVFAPLFYVFKTDPDESNAANAEADSFFCFVDLLSDFRDHFCQQLDNSIVGIRSTIERLSSLLKRRDEELWRHLEIACKVNPQFYAFRWITLLLTQEFNFADIQRLWDSLLSNPDGPLEILLRVCCGMLLSVRSRLLAGDFACNLKLLQHYPPSDIHHLLRVADELKQTNLR